MARPRKETEDKRTHKVTIYLLESELIELDKAAKQLYVGKSQFLVDAMHDKIKKVKQGKGRAYDD